MSCMANSLRPSRPKRRLHRCCLHCMCMCIYGLCFFSCSFTPTRTFGLWAFAQVLVALTTFETVLLLAATAFTTTLCPFVAVDFELSSCSISCLLTAKLARASVELFCYFGVQPKTAGKVKHQQVWLNFGSVTRVFTCLFRETCRVFPLGWETFAEFFKLVDL